MTIRIERPGDAAGIHETNAQAFGSPLEARLVDALRGRAGYLSLVATIDERVVGHILFTPVRIEPPGGREVRLKPDTTVQKPASPSRRVAGLAPMAVRPEHQRSGIGGRLIRDGLEECRRAGYSAVVVLGHPEYYPRFGFVPAHTFGLTCEFPSPPEAFMAIELDAGALKGINGVVRYLPQFAEV